MQRDVSGNWKNPGASLPFPSPENMPIPGWVGPKVALTWDNIPSGQTQYNPQQTAGCRTARWESPLFDLRPEFRSAMVAGEQFTASGSQIGLQPIWRQGSAGQLFVFATLGPPVAPAAGLVLNDLNIVSVEEAHPWSPLEVRPITSEQDITSTFTSATSPWGTVKTNTTIAGMACFEPPGGASCPVRYWRLALTFRFYLTTHADPNVTIAAAFY